MYYPTMSEQIGSIVASNFKRDVIEASKQIDKDLYEAFKKKQLNKE